MIFTIGRSRSGADEGDNGVGRHREGVGRDRRQRNPPVRLPHAAAEGRSALGRVV